MREGGGGAKEETENIYGKVENDNYGFYCCNNPSFKPLLPSVPQMLGWIIYFVHFPDSEFSSAKLSS